MFLPQELLANLKILLSHILILDHKVLFGRLWTPNPFGDLENSSRERLTLERDLVDTIEKGHLYKLGEISEIVGLEGDDQLVGPQLFEDSLLGLTRKIRYLRKLKKDVQ